MATMVHLGDQKDPHLLTSACAPSSGMAEMMSGDDIDSSAFILIPQSKRLHHVILYIFTLK